MRKIIVLTLILSVILFAFSSITTRQRSDGFTYKGLPFAYTKTVDTHGLCVGIVDEVSSVGSCGLRKFRTNQTNLALNFAVCLVISSVAAWGVKYYRANKP